MLQHQTGPKEPIGPANRIAAGCASVGSGCGAENALEEALRRAARSPEGRVLVAVHLSRLMPPGPRAHHRRIARAILEDTARRHEGQVFSLGNGDLALLCREAPPGRPAPARHPHGLALPDPAALPDTMARLLRVDASDPAGITSLWRLEEGLPEITSLAPARPATNGHLEPPPAWHGPGPAPQPGVVDAIAAIAEGSAIADLLHRQPGVLVAAPNRDGASPNAALRPLYREVTFSIAALEARIAATGQAGADPFLFRHLAGRLDRRMLAMLGDAAGKDGVLDIAAGGRGAPPLHINLTLPGILSDRFARFGALCRSLGTAVGVEVALVEACSDAAAFGRARAILADAGLSLVLDGVSHLALMLTRPCALGADLLKLDWSPRLIDLAAEERVQVTAALERIGPHRVILHRAETEAALRWGLTQGIRRFQGRYVDAMLAAGRTMACPSAAGCTLRQCVERAAATGPAGRAGCSATRLLDGEPPLLVESRVAGGAAV